MIQKGNFLSEVKKPVNSQESPLAWMYRMVHQDLIDKGELRPTERKYAYLKYGATDPNLRSKGVFSQLMDFTENEAKSLGFDYFFSDFVTPKMQQFSEKNGFEILKKVYLRDMEIDGHFYFKDAFKEKPDLKNSVIYFSHKKISE